MLALPAKLPVTLPTTLPVTSPVKLPNTFPVNEAVIFPAIKLPLASLLTNVFGVLLFVALAIS